MVKESYKQTEVGVIPEDWEVKSLRTLLKSPPRYGINAAAVPFEGNLPAYIRITDISDDGYYNPDKLVSVDHPQALEYCLQEGDVVFARTGASVGKSYCYSPNDGELVYAGFLIKIQPNPEFLLSAYLSQYVRTDSYWKWVQAMSMRSGQPGINGNEYGALMVPVPAIPEQKAIAKALSDVDSLIDKLEQLITKKQDIKTATMQRLLTGQTRLPGFGEDKEYKQTELGEIPEDWEVTKLGSLGSLFKGKGIKKNESSSGNIPCVRYGEIYTKHDYIVTKYYSYISETIATTATKIKSGDLLFAGSGETKEDIGKCAAFIDDFDAYAGGDIVILRLSYADPVFMGYYCNSRNVNKQKASKGQGDAVVHISASALADIDITLPNLPEQQAIAVVLSDMDRELEALSIRLEKTKSIKQAMMQELLTGKTRLIKPGGLDASESAP